MAHHFQQQTHLLAAPLAARTMGERHDDKDQPLVAVGEAEEQLAGFDSQGLPANFVRRLIQDSQGGAEYSRIRTVTDIPTLEPNSGYCGYLCGSCCGPCFCQITRLIEEGELGLMRRDARYHFLAPGYHRYSSCGNSFEGEPVKISDVDVAVTSGPIGFVTISEAKIGVLLVGSNYKLLAPGTYQWSSPRVRLLLVTSVTERIVRLGPYTLVTVPIGEVAVTFNNGELVVLGHDDGSSPFVAAAAGASAPKRTYFLENAKWELHGFLPVVMQTDRLEGNDLLSKDNVEVLMVAMSQWRIVQPVRAVQNCAPRMEEIRVKVNQLVRATIARIVAGTCIGAGPVSGAASRPVVTAQPVMSASGDDEKKMPQPSRNGGGEPDLAHLMKSEMAEKHMAELTVLMDQMGIEVCGVYVPEKRMKNDDIRKEVAKQAVIGIKAEAERAAADAKAYATVKAARAEAEAIEVLARAHADAGERLGDPQTTASRLALSETLSKVMRDANLTVFSGAPESMPFMMTGAPAGGQHGRANRIEPRPHA